MKSDYSSTKKKKGKIVVQITEIEIVYCLYRMIKKIIIFRIDSTHWIKKYYSNKHGQFNILKIINFPNKWLVCFRNKSLKMYEN